MSARRILSDGQASCSIDYQELYARHRGSQGRARTLDLPQHIWISLLALGERLYCPAAQIYLRQHALVGLGWPCQAEPATNAKVQVVKQKA
jgi:hypothetical protein